ncbi:MAG: zinc ribbon domain-containing protein [Candidatus Micrarchaeia archaeon]
MLEVLLSFGAVNALIPIIIIVILILAAAGLTRGYDLFAAFGIGTLIGIGGSAQKGSLVGRNPYKATYMSINTLNNTKEVKQKKRVQKNQKNNPAANQQGQPSPNQKMRLFAQSEKPKSFTVTHKPMVSDYVKMAVGAYSRRNTRDQIVKQTLSGALTSNAIQQQKNMLTQKIANKKATTKDLHKLLMLNIAEEAQKDVNFQNKIANLNQKEKEEELKKYFDTKAGYTSQTRLVKAFLKRDWKAVKEELNRAPRLSLVAARKSTLSKELQKSPKICPYCGTKNPGDAEFCIHCGNKL